MNDFDCPTSGPGYYEPDGYEDACQEAYEQGAKSRDSEMRSVTDELSNAQQEIERLALLDEHRAGNDPIDQPDAIAAAVKAERERIAVLIDVLLTKAEREETYAGKQPYANCGATHGVGSYDLEGLANSLREAP